MNITYHSDASNIDWSTVKQDLINDDFHNGRTTHQLKLSFENSQVRVFAMDETHCIGTARALSDGVGNAYVIDVWTHSSYRLRGIAGHMMNEIFTSCQGQHIYLQTDDTVAFYRKLGFSEQPEGMSLINGEYLHNETR